MWKKCEYTRGQINRAGRRVVDPNISPSEREECIKIIDSFRAAHAYPMNTFAINLKHKVEGIKSAIVVQRLKRLDTILYKLERFPKMELARMQDLGGCRVVVPKIEDVYTIVKRMRDSRIRHIEHNCKDYIATPNPNTGYRGYHLIYRYNSDKNEDYNGLLIELQIRTELQHLWATAVETVGIFTENQLKFNNGSEKWLLFFKLTSALFAIEEKSAVMDGVSTDPLIIYKQWIQLLKELNVIQTLTMIGITTKSVGHIMKKTNQKGYYLIKLNSAEKSIEIEIFEGAEKNLEAATREYNKIEQEKGDAPINCVLVSASSYETLVRAYPNYFLDVRKFLDYIVNTIMKKYTKEICKRNCKLPNDGTE